MYTWGHGANGRLGVGDTERNGVPDNQKAYFPVPVHLRSLEPIKQISCGTDHTLASGNAGAWAWGNGSGGKLGKELAFFLFRFTVFLLYVGRLVFNLTAHVCCTQGWATLQTGTSRA